MSGHNGMKNWLVQRISAVYLAGFILFLTFSLATNAPDNWLEWRAWVADPINNVGFGLFFLALLWHAWIGLHDVILDYLKPFSLRLLVLILLGMLWVAMGIWVVRILVMND